LEWAALTVPPLLPELLDPLELLALDEEELELELELDELELDELELVAVPLDEEPELDEALEEELELDEDELAAVLTPVVEPEEELELDEALDVPDVPLELALDVEDEAVADELEVEVEVELEVEPELEEDEAPELDDEAEELDAEELVVVVVAETVTALGWVKSYFSWPLVAKWTVTATVAWPAATPVSGRSRPCVPDAGTVTARAVRVPCTDASPAAETVTAMSDGPALTRVSRPLVV
jgi:hypothetical protein